MNSYLGKKNIWGHKFTRTVKYKADRNWVDYKVYTPIFHKIYSRAMQSGSGQLMYKATKVAAGIKNPDLLHDFQEACKSAEGYTYNGSIPDDTYAFCYWPGMGKTKLTVRYEGPTKRQTVEVKS